MSASRCGAVFIFFWVMGLLCVEGHLLSFMGSAGAELGLAAPAKGSHYGLTGRMRFAASLSVSVLEWPDKTIKKKISGPLDLRVERRWPIA